MENEIFDAYKKILPILSELIQEDVASCITDTEKCIELYESKNVPINFKVGDIIPSDNPLAIAMSTKKVISGIVPKEAYGVAFRAIAYPITDQNGKVIGGIGIGKSLDTHMKIEDIAGNLFSSLNQTGGAVGDIAEGSQRLSEIMSSITSSVSETKNKIDETDSIIGSIQNIASQSNLLALNAAIESSRAGESGKGFSVVAKEMRKLSQNSSESVKKVSDTLIEMKQSIEAILNQINEANMVAENHAAATEQVNAAIDEINQSFKELINEAEKI